MIKDGRFEAQIALAWGLKDAGLALDVAKDIQMPALERTHEVWAKAVEAGLGELDIAAVYRRLGKNARQEQDKTCHLRVLPISQK
jgi:3-hydroxyisobutyrate dehydrogenase